MFMGRASYIILKQLDSVSAIISVGNSSLLIVKMSSTELKTVCIFCMAYSWKEGQLIQEGKDDFDINWETIDGKETYKTTQWQSCVSGAIDLANICNTVLKFIKTKPCIWKRALTVILHYEKPKILLASSCAEVSTIKVTSWVLRYSLEWFKV